MTTAVHRFPSTAVGRIASLASYKFAERLLSLVLCVSATTDALAWSSETQLASAGSIPCVTSVAENQALSVWGAGNNILFSRSTTGGQSWTPAQTLNDDVGAELHQNARVASDRNGHAVCVYMKPSTGELFASRSDDGGTTWLAHAVFANGTLPDIATDRQGHWMTAYTNSTTITVKTSSTNGATWGPPITVGTGDGSGPGVATDRAGHWTVVWGNNNTLYSSRSANGGISWTTAQSIGAGRSPSLAANTTGTLIVAGVVDNPGAWHPNTDVACYKSVNNAVSWNPLSFPFNSDSSGPSCSFCFPKVIAWYDDGAPQVAAGPFNEWAISFATIFQASYDDGGYTALQDLNVVRFDANTSQWIGPVATFNATDADDTNYATDSVFSSITNDDEAGWICDWEVTQPDGSRSIESSYDSFISSRNVKGLVAVDGMPLANVELAGFPTTVLTDSFGNYSATVPANWTGTIAPTLTNYTFVPPSANISAGGETVVINFVAIGPPPPSPWPQPEWHEPLLLHHDAHIPQVVSGGGNRYVAVWNGQHAFKGPPDLEGSIGSAYSIDGGVTWSSAAKVNDNGFSGAVVYPRLASGGNGNWMTTYMDAAGGNVAVSYSGDGGAGWQPHVTIGPGAHPEIASDGKGTWLVAYNNGTTVTVTRSTDNGSTWTSPVVVGPGDGFGPSLQTDGNGTWIAMWVKEQVLYSSRSIDNGSNWTPPLAAGPGYSSGYGGGPALATNGHGKWIAADLIDRPNQCQSNTDLVFYISNNNGTTWAPLPFPLNEGSTCSNPDSYTRIDEFMPDIATDRKGNWIVTYSVLTRHINTFEYGDYHFKAVRYNEETSQWDLTPQAFVASDPDAYSAAGGGVFSSITSNGDSRWVLAMDYQFNGVSYDAYYSYFDLVPHVNLVPPFNETFTTSTGAWGQFGSSVGDATIQYDSVNEALLTRIGTASPGDWRIAGWISSAADSLPYSAVGSDHFVRAKFQVFASGQSGTALNEIPNFRARVANRFAVSSILTVNNHTNVDPASTLIAQDIRPSTSPLAPSVYRVDMDPVDVPQLVNNPITEGFLRAFEIYEAEPQANGNLELVECTVGVYPALPNFGTTVPVTQNGLIKRYLPGPAGGDFGNGNLAQTNSIGIFAKYSNGTLDNTGFQPSFSVSSAGVTLDTLVVDSTQLGIVAFDVFNDPGDQTNHLTRARVEPGKQYKVRFHATSVWPSNTQPVIRFRAKTINFQYTASMEVGGATGASVQSNMIAAQALPGVGNMIPTFDRIDPSENGGWYNVVMVSPMNHDIQPIQPNLEAQDPPGISTSVSNSKSHRDLQFGFDLIDTFSTQPGSGRENGQMTVDRVEIEKYDLVPD